MIWKILTFVFGAVAIVLIIIVINCRNGVDPGHPDPFFSGGPDSPTAGHLHTETWRLEGERGIGHTWKDPTARFAFKDDNGNLFMTVSNSAAWTNGNYPLVDVSALTSFKWEAQNVDIGGHLHRVRLIRAADPNKHLIAVNVTDADGTGGDHGGSGHLDR
jgi:hypothetical protein